MIDIQLLRSNPDAVAARLATRGGYPLDVARFRELEGRRKQVQTLVEKIQAERNQIAKQIGQAKAKGEAASELLKKAELGKTSLGASEQQLAKIQEELQQFVAGIPNLPHESVPLGKSSHDNAERRRHGTQRKFE